MTAFDTCYASVLAAEGGFVNNIRDPGGITSLGVTKAAWQAWVAHTVTEQDMRKLTPTLVAPFYRSQYWNAIHGDYLPIGLALAMFHCAVNAGPKRATTLLQTAVGATPDGAIGPATMAKIRGLDQKSLIHIFQDALRAYYRTLSTFDVFGAGWMNRARDVERQAVELVP